MNAPRAYRDTRDLQAMQQLLIDGRKADNGSYYIHIGDLKWWLYYPPLEGDYWNCIHLWDDPDQPGRLLGWALISPNWMVSDVYVQPELRGTESAQNMYIWAEEQALSIARKQGRRAICVLWVRHDDEALSEHLVRRGFQLKKGLVHLTRNLAGDLLPAGEVDVFGVRECNGVPEVEARALAQHEAFKSRTPMTEYVGRLTRFMCSTVYQSELDVVAATPDGRIGAFCLIWMDSVNKVGLFEPVGTHPDYQRKGLGKAVMLEGLRRLQERGMKSAIVSTDEDNLPAIKLYQAIGFNQVFQLGTYEKDV